MKLGMNMLLWSTDVTGPEYLPVFEMLGEAGYDGIEVPIFGAADLGALRRLGEHLDGLGLVPLGVTACAQDDSPISADPAVRARTLEATKAAIDGCAALGARTAVRTDRGSARRVQRHRSDRRRDAPTPSRACALPPSTPRAATSRWSSSTSTASRCTSSPARPTRPHSCVRWTIRTAG